MRKLLVVVDMQNDFVTGALKNDMAKKIIANIKARVELALSANEPVIFTKDTHGDTYMETEEGKNLPVPHCLMGTDGWEIVPELHGLSTMCEVINKYTFGSTRLAERIREIMEHQRIDEIEIIGICTDICVISNAAVIKAFIHNTPICVDASCCAGVTVESHDIAIAAMEAMQIHIENVGQEPWRVK